MTKVLSHNGGSNNLKALIDLLAGDGKQSKLKRLEDFGFTAEQLIKVLSNGELTGRSYETRLLRPSQSPFLSALGVNRD